MKIVEGLFYSDDHEWVRVEGSKAYIGITDFAQSSLGEIVYVELPELGDEVEEGEIFGVIESVKAASDVFSPVTGEVIEINEELEDSPELLNEDAFENWILQVELSDEAELEELMDADQYKEFCEEE